MDIFYVCARFLPKQRFCRRINVPLTTLLRGVTSVKQPMYSAPVIIHIDGRKANTFKMICDKKLQVPKFDIIIPKDNLMLFYFISVKLTQLPQVFKPFNLSLKFKSYLLQSILHYTKTNGKVRTVKMVLDCLQIFVYRSSYLEYGLHICGKVYFLK